MAQAKTTRSRPTGGSSGAKKASEQRSKGGSGGQASSRSRSTGGRSTKRSSRSGNLSSDAGKSSQGSKRRPSRTESKSTIAAFADKAKGPALAGGVALAGLAGGMALTRRRRSRGLLSRLPSPKLNNSSFSLPKLSPPQVKAPKSGTIVKSVGRAAEEVAKRSEQVGRVATGVQKASEAIDGTKDQ
jgi:hypothetical protein